MYHTALTEGGSMSVLITGVAGFIGFHLAETMLDQGRRVVGVDNLNDYYDPEWNPSGTKGYPDGSAI